MINESNIFFVECCKNNRPLAAPDLRLCRARGGPRAARLATPDWLGNRINRPPHRYFISISLHRPSLFDIIIPCSVGSSNMSPSFSY